MANVNFYMICLFRLQKKLRELPTEYSENQIDIDEHLKEGRYQSKVDSFLSVIASLRNSDAWCSGGKSVLKFSSARSSNVKDTFAIVLASIVSYRDKRTQENKNYQYLDIIMSIETMT